MLGSNAAAIVAPHFFSSKAYLKSRKATMAVPNLYQTPLPKGLHKEAEADPLGTVTLWTYFHNCLQQAVQRGSEEAVGEQEICEAAQEDLVYASFLIFANTSKAELSKGGYFEAVGRR